MSDVVVTWSPSWVLAAGLTATAVALSWLTVRIAKAPALHRWQRWLHAGAVLAWATAAWTVALRLLSGLSPVETAMRGLLVSLVVAIALPILRDVIAGFALVLGGRHRLGDCIRVGALSGRIVEFGLRSVVVREPDGTETTLPHRRLATLEVVHPSPASRDSPCELDVTIPSDRSLADVRERLREAALLSPYAAPGRRPEVFVVADQHGTAQLRVVGYVFDPACAERFRGDVLTRAELLNPLSRP